MSNPPGLHIDANGYFSRGSERIIPVGVNYWPGSCGVDMWQAWPEDEIKRDLDLMVKLGLNCMRFFLRWQEFEPVAGQYDGRQFARLDRMLGWFAERGIYAQPSLIVGGMSGGTFWPSWKGSRNVFTDPYMVERSAELARRAAQVIAPWHANICGIDYGNEMDGLEGSEPSQIRHWCQTFAGAIRSAYPKALLISGVSGGPIGNDSSWRYSDDLGTDFHSFHCYPMPMWQGVQFDGIRDRFAQALLPHGVAAIRAHGPVMVQEFGTLITAGASQQDEYLRGALPAAWKAGANGFLWWCLKDIHSRAYNYVRASMEETLGLVDDSGKVKPGLQAFIDFARDVQKAPIPDLKRPVALYWPKHYYSRENPNNVGNNPGSVNNRKLSAFHALTLAGIDSCQVFGGRAIPAHVKSLLIAGCHLDSDEVAALTSWVRAGGRILWHGPYWNEWGPGLGALLGAMPADFRLRRGCTVAAFGQDWEFKPWHTPEECRLELAVSGAKPVANDDSGFPMLWSHNLGAGKVVFCLASVEEAILNCLGDPKARDRWSGWYAGALKLLEK